MAKGKRAKEQKSPHSVRREGILNGIGVQEGRCPADLGWVQLEQGEHSAKGHKYDVVGSSKAFSQIKSEKHK